MENGAYFTIKESVYAEDKIKCDVLVPWETDFPNLLAMAVPKGSKYYKMFKYQNLRQMEVGTWQVTKK